MEKPEIGILPARELDLKRNADFVPGEAPRSYTNTPRAVLPPLCRPRGYAVCLLLRFVGPTPPPQSADCHEPSPEQSEGTWFGNLSSELGGARAQKRRGAILGADGLNTKEGRAASGGRRNELRNGCEPIGPDHRKAELIQGPTRRRTIEDKVEVPKATHLKVCGRREETPA